MQWMQLEISSKFKGKKIELTEWSLCGHPALSECTVKIQEKGYWSVRTFASHAHTFASYTPGQSICTYSNSPSPKNTLHVHPPTHIHTYIHTLPHTHYPGVHTTVVETDEDYSVLRHWLTSYSHIHNTCCALLRIWHTSIIFILNFFLHSCFISVYK